VVVLHSSKSAIITANSGFLLLLLKNVVYRQLKKLHVRAAATTKLLPVRSKAATASPIRVPNSID